MRGIIDTVRDIQVIARGESRSARHDRVFLVRIIARQRGVILRVDRSLCLEAIQRWTAAIEAGQDDFARTLGPLDRVTADDCGPINGPESKDGVGGILPEPPDLEMVG